MQINSILELILGQVYHMEGGKFILQLSKLGTRFFLDSAVSWKLDRKMKSS